LIDNVQYSVRDVTPRSRSRPRLPSEMRRSHATAKPHPRDASSDDDDDDDVSSDVSGSSAPGRRRHQKRDKDTIDDASSADVPRFFYGRATTGDNTNRHQQTDDVIMSRDYTRTDDVSTPHVSRDTSVVGVCL